MRIFKHKIEGFLTNHYTGEQVVGIRMGMCLGNDEEFLDYML